MNNKRRTNQSSQRGMTLVEVIVATSIFIVILMAAMMIYDQSNKMFKTSVESADLQQNTRAGFDRLVADVRMAGFDADRDGVPVRAPAGPWSPNTTYATGSVVSPTMANDFSYRAVTGGTSGALEPVWPTTAGASLTGDGTVSWIAIGPAYQQSDEQIEFAGRSAITLRGNLDYNIVSPANPHHGREIEYEPAGGQFPIVTTANDEIVTYALRSVNGPNPNTLTFYADVSKPRSVHPGGSAETLVSIPNVDLCEDGCNNPPYTLMRFTLKDDGTPDDGTPVANNVRNLEFFYYQDGQGTTLLKDLNDTAVVNDHGAVGGLGQYDPANIGGTPNWDHRTIRAKVAAIRVQLVGMNEQPDRRYINPTETLASAKNYRTYNLESLVTPRNLGLSGMAEPDTAAPGPPVVTSVCVGACRVTRVRWNPPLTGNVETYEVRYDTNPTGTFNNIGVVVPGDVISAPVFGLTPGTLYYFKVMAINENGTRISDNYLSRSPINSTRPGPIANLVVTEGASAQQNKITLSFTTPANNDPALANMSCQGVQQDGSAIDPSETIRYRVWRGTTEDFNPVTTPASAEVVLENTVAIQPNGVPGAQVTWIDNFENARAKPPANCKNYFYRVQVYDLCSLNAAENNPAQVTTGQSSIFPLADATTTEDAIAGYASSTVPPVKPADLVIDYSGTNSRCNKGQNTCDVKLEWDAVTMDTSNPTQMITVDQYRISRERKKASDATWTFDTILPVVVNASSDPTYIEPGGIVTYHDTTALDHDPNDRRKWYYRYTVTALQCGAASEVSAPVQFPQSCGLAASTVIESGSNSGNGSLAAPWVMGPGDHIRVIPPPDEELDEVEFEVFPEPDDNPNNAALVRATAGGPEFQFDWESLSDGQVYRVVITMRNAAGCTEQTERFMMDDPVNCASGTVTQVGSSGGSGTSSQPWIMANTDTDKITVNAPSGVDIESVTFTLFNHPGNTLAVAQGPPDVEAPFEFPWPTTLIDNQVYRLQMDVVYEGGCAETFERFIMEEPPPVCSGATMSATGASSGAGTLVSPWLVNGGDVLTITPPTNGVVNQIVFTITPVAPAGAALPVVTDSTAPYALTWVDRDDNTVYKIDAVITYNAANCSETITRYVKDQVCAGATVSANGSTGAGTGLTTASPWVFDAGDTITVAPPNVLTTITNVQFTVYNEPGTTVLATNTDATSPYQTTWANRVDDALYRVEILVTYTAGCTETIIRYVRDQGACFITASAPAISNFDDGNDGIATISYTISNPTNNILKVEGVKIDWLRAQGFPISVIESIQYIGATSASQTVSAANGAPPTTGVLTAPATAPTIEANNTTYVIRIRFNLGRKQDVGSLTESPINKLCIQYSTASLGASIASCNVLGSTTGNPGACN